MAETMSNKSNDYKRDAENDEIKSIVFRTICIDWIYNPCIFNILSECR